MARRQPLETRELLKLLEAGYSQSEAARMMGYPVGTVTGQIKRLRDRGILGPGDIVDWEVLDRWGREHRPKAYREAGDAEGNTHVIPKVIPKGIPQVIRDVIPAVGGLDEQEVKELRDVLGWWRDRERTLSVIQGVIQSPSQKSVRSFRIEDDVYSALRILADEQGRSMGELVNEAIRWYLQGHRGNRGVTNGEIR